MRCLLLALLLAATAASALTIGRISFETGLSLDREQLLQATGLRTGDEYDPAAVGSAVTALQSYLASRGHPFVRIPNPELIPLSEDSLELRFTISEVLAAESIAIRFNGLRYFTEAKLRSLLLIREDRTYGVNELPGLLNLVLDLYQSRGYLFASVELDSLVLRDGLTAFIGVREGGLFRPERYYFEGNKHTRDDALLRLSGLSQARTVTPSVLAGAEQNILRKSYITSCLVEPIDETSLLIKVEEGRMTYLEGVLGLNQRSGKTELTGLARLRFLNLWGSDRSVSLNWRRSILSGELQLSYHESGLNRFPLSGDLLLSRVTQDSTWIRSSFETEVYSYHGFQRYGIELAAQDVAPGSRRPILVERNASRSIGAFWRLDSRDQTVNPRKGVEAYVVYRMQNSDRGKRWRGAFEADNTTYLALSRRWVPALGFHLRNLEDREAEDYSLFRMGGYGSLRGYREDEFSSWRLGWINLELRYLVSVASRVYLFWDQGILAQGSSGYRTDIFAPGLGLKVKTRLGVLGLEYALGYRENGFAGFGGGMVHAGIDASF
jgi:outer membrane protein assembly factor BamA